MSPQRYDRLKRPIEAACAAVGLVVLSPLLLAVAAAVLVDLGRPVLFRQARPGRHGRPFVLVKFRTMRPGAGAEPTGDAPRLTTVGRLLRATSLDELPSLYNVVRGELSFVGPRPLLMCYLDRYTPRQARRHEVRPGLTGLAQLRGRNRLSWQERLALDVWYVDHRSPALDLRILAGTARMLWHPDGLAAAGTTAAEFQGSPAAGPDAAPPGASTA